MKLVKLTAVLALTLIGGTANAELLSVSGGVELDVGLEKPVIVPDSQPLRVAMFMATQSNVSKADIGNAR